MTFSIFGVGKEMEFLVFLEKNKSGGSLFPGFFTRSKNPVGPSLCECHGTANNLGFFREQNHRGGPILFVTFVYARSIPVDGGHVGRSEPALRAQSAHVKCARALQGYLAHKKPPPLGPL